MRRIAVVVVAVVVHPTIAAQDRDLSQTFRNIAAREAAREAAGCTSDDLLERLECFELFSQCEPVAMLIEDLPESASLARERVETLVESRLRAARLFNGADPYGDPLTPFLYVNVGVIGRAFTIRVELHKFVHDQSSRVAWATPTWNTASAGTHGGDDGFILQGVSEHMDRFILEYLRVNDSACE